MKQFCFFVVRCCGLSKGDFVTHDVVVRDDFETALGAAKSLYSLYPKFQVTIDQVSLVTTYAISKDELDGGFENV